MKEITPEELKDILEKHKQWVESDGKEGERADLQEVNLGGKDLKGVNLRDANLAQTHLDDANLKGTILREANLQDADLRGVKGLSVKQLAGAKVSGITLPKYGVG